MKVIYPITILCGLFLIGCFVSTTPVIAKQIIVPFTSQAPDARWVQPWQDLCEEASVVMVDQYYQDQTLSKAKAKKLLLNTFRLKTRVYGSSLDESVTTITDLINNFLPWEAMVVYRPTIEQIKTEIAESRPVIIPVSGRDLNNPRFRHGGPRYHMLVLSGYDDETQEFITQEPGTAYGLDFRYSYDTIMGAMHDLVSGDIRDGEPRAIFTQKQVEKSGGTDGDRDGLTKALELSLGTSLTEKDTDKDGFSDGKEVETGYSPLVNERGLPEKSLVKSEKDNHVYLLKNQKKHEIVSEAAFLSHGFAWQNIKTVSDRFLNALSFGPKIEA